MQEPVYLAVEKGKEDRGNNITCAETGEKQGFGDGPCVLYNSRQDFSHSRIIQDDWIGLKTEFEEELLSSDTGFSFPGPG